MGYYIEAPSNKGKAEWLCSTHEGTLLQHAPSSLRELPEGKGLVCVVDNGPFEAAGFIFSDSELRVFSSPSNYRPKKWVVMDKAKAAELSGYRG